MKHKKMYISLFIFGALILSVIIFMNLPRFGQNPSGERLKRIEQSPNYRDGAFRNLKTTPQLTSDKSRIEVMYNFLFEKRARNRPEQAMQAIKSDLKSLPTDSNLIVWFGHSSYFLQLDGVKILVDPVFYDASPISLFNKPFDGTDIYRAEDMPDIDYLLITHDHWDHLDHTLVTKMRDRIGKVICPLGVGEHFEYWKYPLDKIVELDWNEKTPLGEYFELYCYPARHFSGRSLNANKTLWASFLLKSPSQTIYISGDGGYDDHFAKIARKHNPIDLAIIENGQYNKEWKYIHLMPEETVKAINDLNPLKVIAGHNSKYALAKHQWDEPMALITKARLPLLTPKIGEVIYLPAK